jgi:hypothetical protein
MPYLKFADSIKILPYSDDACDGLCAETLQTSIKFKLTQSTDVSKKTKDFF